MIHHASSLPVWVLLLACVLANASNDAITTTESAATVMSKMIYSLTNESVYNKNIRPYFGEKPVLVKILYSVEDIISVSDHNNDMTVTIAVTQAWTDPRLNFTPFKNVTELELVRDLAKLIWLPDTYVRNAKSLSMQLSDSTLASAQITLREGGSVVYRNTFTITVNCPMDLKYFPVDQQNCKLIMTSYGHAASQIQLRWKDYFDVLMISNITLSTFTLTSQKSSVGKTVGRLYDALICELCFKRTLGYYINQIYVPAFLIVVISWIPFWLDRNDNHARVGLGVTTVLTITTLVTSTNESLPKVSYIKAIDIYLAVCFGMVFLSLIEFATIGFFESKIQSQAETTNLEEPETDDKLDGKVDKLKGAKNKKKTNTAFIDKVSRVLFPVVFITFNIAYVGFLWVIRNIKQFHGN